MAKAIRSDIIELGSSTTLLQGSADPSAGGGVAANIGSFYWRTTNSVIWQKVGSAATAWVPLVPQSFFGDGSDGAVTISGTTTLTGDVYYSSLTVQNGGILQTNGCRIWCRGDLVVDTGGIIRQNGVSPAGSAQGGNTNGTTWGTTGGAGGNGNTGGGSAGTGSGNFPTSGGSGGAGGTGIAAGGTAGAATIAAAARGNLRSFIVGQIGSYLGIGYAQITGGAGGGGGGGSGSVAGGAGAGGGGYVMLNARTITNNGTISANGGTGAPGQGVNSSGGGGGGGGVVIYNTHAFAGTTPVANGGTGGASGGGSGTAGANGVAGAVFFLQS